MAHRLTPLGTAIRYFFGVRFLISRASCHAPSVARDVAFFLGENNANSATFGTSVGGVTAWWDAHSLSICGLRSLGAVWQSDRCCVLQPLAVHSVPQSISGTADCRIKRHARRRC